MVVKQKKILHIHSSAEVGGTELRAFQVASRLKKDFDIAVLFHSRPGAMLERYRQEGIPFWNVRFPRIVPAFRLIRTFKPDIVHMYGLEVNVLWRPVLYLMGYRHLIGHIGGLSNYSEQPGWLRIHSDRLTYRFLKRYVLNSAKVADRLMAYGFDKNRLHVIHSGIVIKERPAHRNTNTPPVIVSVGNLRPVKGHPFLIESFRILSERGIDFEARIVGEGPDRSLLTALVHQYRLDDCVRFDGAIENSMLHAALCEADIFALMSLSEGISGAAMEAMAAGLPVVATDVGGMSELVEEGVNGYLVPSRATSLAAERMATLLTQPSLREKMGVMARTKIESKFRLERTVREYEKLYQSL